MTSNQAWLQRYQQTCLPIFSPDRVLVRGLGADVWDADGKHYLDLVAGLAVNALGHAHPAYVSAVWQQLTTLGHVSNLFTSPPQIELAERLVALSGQGAQARVFLCNSGTEAVEAALKMVLRTQRPRIIAFEGGFHGRSLGALALTHKADYRKPFEPLPGNVQFLPFGDHMALRSAMSHDVGGIVLEMIQGEAGVRPAPPGFVAEARRLADIYGALLIIDEVQTGMGRTGTWFAHTNPALVEQPVIPDIVTLAKGLGSGWPIGAVLTLSQAATNLLQPGQHGTTFGGNPPAAAAALATIQTIEAEGLLEHTCQLGDWLCQAISSLNHHLIAGVRGAGLLRGIVLHQPQAHALAQIAAQHGFLINPVASDVIRLAPPLILSQTQAERFVQALPKLLDLIERKS
ncbi:MAG: acetylornithine transaminase [Bifidobacteriaceae bacterium]|jgi:acetylornithine aminotransferase|nr:acetylornithine transaminase [Bifidobacteriaceae bacterium]